MESIVTFDDNGILKATLASIFYQNTPSMVNTLSFLYISKNVYQLTLHLLRKLKVISLMIQHFKRQCFSDLFTSCCSIKSGDIINVGQFQ